MTSNHSRPASVMTEGPGGGDLLACDICLEYYSESARPPKFLACFHSFCEPCLLQVAVAETNTVECPSCRKVMQLPPGGVRELQTNFYVCHMQDVVCKLGAPKTKGCQRHSNQPMSFFCQKCGISICRDCIVLDHKENDGHIVQDVKAAEIEQRDGLSNEVESARAAVKSMQSQIQNIETEMGNLGIAKDTALKEIELAFKDYQTKLEARKMRVVRNVSELFNERQGGLLERYDKLSQLLTKLRITLGSCEKISERGALAEVVCGKETIHKATEELRKLASDREVGENYLKFDSKNGLEVFEAGIGTLSRVMMEGELPSRVHYDFGELVASSSCEFSMQVFGYCQNDRLYSYPIDIVIYDSTEVVTPSKVSKCDTKGYVVTFTPQMSGKHRLVPLFLGQPITGAETTVHVKSNNPVYKIGSLGYGEGKFCCPRAIACDKNGCLYVADTGNKLIQKFDKDGNFRHQFKISAGTEDCSTCDLALNHEKGLIVCTETMVGTSVNPTMGNTVATYTTEGKLVHKFCNKVMKCALCVATNRHSEIIISDYLVHSLFMYDEQGNFLRRIGNANAFNHPAFICIGDNDSVIVSDTNNDVIQIFDRQGHFVNQFGRSGSGKGALKQPFGVAYDGENILVVDSGNKRIQVFKRDGSFVSMIESLDDALNQPRGMVLTDDGHVWVADRDSNCIKKYRYK